MITTSPQACGRLERERKNAWRNGMGLLSEKREVIIYFVPLNFKTK